MQSSPAVKDEEKKTEELVSEPETVAPVVEVEEKTENTITDDFSIDNVMDEVENISMDPEPTPPDEPILVDPEPMVSAPEPVTIEVEPVVEDVTIAVEPELVYVPEPEPVYEAEPTPVYQPVVIEHTPTPIMEIKTEPEPLVVSPEPIYTAPADPVYEPEPLGTEEPEPVIEAAPVEAEPIVSAPEPVVEAEVVSTPEVIIEPVVETTNMMDYNPDPAIKELMEDFAKNLSMKIRLVDLLKSGEVKKETFNRLFESYLARGDHLMNSRNEMLERVKYELESKEKSYNETNIGLEELKIKRTIGDVSEGEYSAKSPGLSWDINKYENEVNQKNAEIVYLSDISRIMNEREITELVQKGNNCLDGLDQLAYSNILDPETAGRVRVSIEEAIACLKA